jgi:hypothetical protein
VGCTSPPVFTSPWGPGTSATFRFIRFAHFLRSRVRRARCTTTKSKVTTTCTVQWLAVAIVGPPSFSGRHPPSTGRHQHAETCKLTAGSKFIKPISTVSK